ncbi:hypothetical protein EVG20_g11175 [Dentipellis fragilis]|uniref:Uncharacterized protein n=1 Tax=Dentipellis fragilis TaxID=205917 RepID=A0A4Y9XMU3_9AGAM|nr:hypothetical protein EVG20_g11175 [Dentipellis fragilis]
MLTVCRRPSNLKDGQAQHIDRADGERFGVLPRGDVDLAPAIYIGRARSDVETRAASLLGRLFENSGPCRLISRQLNISSGGELPSPRRGRAYTNLSERTSILDRARCSKRGGEEHVVRFDLDIPLGISYLHRSCDDEQQLAVGAQYHCPVRFAQCERQAGSCIVSSLAHWWSSCDAFERLGRFGQGTCAHEVLVANDESAASVTSRRATHEHLDDFSWILRVLEAVDMSFGRKGDNRRSQQLSWPFHGREHVQMQAGSPSAHVYVWSSRQAVLRALEYFRMAHCCGKNAVWV